MLVFQCYHFSKQFLSNLSKIKYLAFFITFCFVVSLAKMVALTNNSKQQKSAQHRKYIWTDISLRRNRFKSLATLRLHNIFFSFKDLVRLQYSEGKYPSPGLETPWRHANFRENLDRKNHHLRG